MVTYDCPLSAPFCPTNSPTVRNHRSGDFTQAAWKRLRPAANTTKVWGCGGSPICPENVPVSRVSEIWTCEMAIWDASRWS